MTILELAVLLLALLSLPGPRRIILHLFTNFYYNYTTAGTLAYLIDGIGDLEREADRYASLSNIDESLPAGVRARLAKLPERVRR